MSEPRDAFARDGFVRIPDVVPAPGVAAMRAALLDGLAGVPLIDVGGARRPAPAASERLWAIGRAAALAPLPIALGVALARVFGEGAWIPADVGGGLPQPALPVPGPWAVAEAAWHVDEPTFPGQPRGWGVLGFALLDDVVPGGGATVILAGSAARLGALADARGGVIVTEDALAALRDGAAWRDGLREVELTGAAGDVIVMDPRALHTVSANRTARPRLQVRLTARRGP